MRYDYPLCWLCHAHPPILGSHACRDCRRVLVGHHKWILAGCPADESPFYNSQWDEPIEALAPIQDITTGRTLEGV